MAKIVGMSLDYLVKNLYDMIYPVGICIDFDSESVDPNVAFPGTTWVRILDKRYFACAPIGAAGTVGGSANFSISAANLPAHSHTMAHTHSIDHNHGTITSSSNGAHTHTGNGTTGSSGDHSHTRGTMNITGEFANNGEAWKNTDTSGYASGAFARTSTRNVTSNRESSAGGCFYSFDAAKTWTGNTSSSGIHTHSYDFTTSSSGAHTHTTAIPNFSGDSGGSSAANTGSVGSGTAISYDPIYHYYARWKRTA